MNKIRIVLLHGLLFFGTFTATSCCSSEEKDNGLETTKQIIEIRNKAFEGKLHKIEEDFNAIQFKQGSAELPDGVRLSLKNLGKLLQKNPSYKLHIVGHTSAEGTIDFNNALSTKRAQSIVNFLVKECGVKSTRLSSEGKGSTELKDKDNPTAQCNRRTEFKIVK